MIFLTANDRSWYVQTWRLLQAIRRSVESRVGLQLCSRNVIQIPLPLGPALQLTPLCSGGSANIWICPKPPSGLSLTSHWLPPRFQWAHLLYIQCSILNSGIQIRILSARKTWGKGFVCSQPLSSACVCVCVCVRVHMHTRNHTLSHFSHVRLFVRSTYTWGKLAAPALTSQSPGSGTPFLFISLLFGKQKSSPLYNVLAFLGLNSV